MTERKINWKRNALILGFVEFCVRSMMMMVRPYIPLYLPELGVEDAAGIAYWTGLLSSVNFIALAVATPFWGRLADRVGKKPMVIRCVFFMGIFSLFLAMAESPGQFLVIRLIMGAISGVNAAATAMVATTTPEEELGWAIGVIQMGYMGGTLMGPVLGSLLANIVGYRGCLIAAGIMILFLLPFVILGVNENFVREENKEKKDTAPGGAWSGRWKALRNMAQFKAITIFILVLCLSQFALQGSDSFITLLMKEIDRGDHLNVVVAVSFGALAAANVLSSTWMGRLGDRLGNVKVMSVSFLGFTACLGLQAVVGTPGLILLRMLEGVTIAGILPNAYTCITKMTEAHSRGGVLGIASGMAALGSFLGPNVCGFVGARSGIRAIFPMLCVVMGGFGLVVLPMLSRLNRKTGRKL